MAKNRNMSCTICNQPIKTARGALQMQNTPLVCRRCFGEQSYGSGTQRWILNTAGPDAVTSEG
jgi:hypothetical protein